MAPDDSGIVPGAASYISMASDPIGSRQFEEKYRFKPA